MQIFLEAIPDWNKQFAAFSLCLPAKEAYNKELRGYFPICSQQLLYNGNFCVTDRIDFYQWSNYAPSIGDRLLNSEYIMLPAKELERQKFTILGLFGVDCKVFVRPNVGLKVFTGHVLDIEQFAAFGQDFSNQLIVISRPQEILGEWRFMVTQEAEILGVSLYKYQDNFVQIPSCPPKMRDFVESVAKDISDLPKLVIIDIAQTLDGKYHVVELNSAHSSGLYGMRPEPIVDYIARLV